MPNNRGERTFEDVADIVQDGLEAVADAQMSAVKDGDEVENRIVRVSSHKQIVTIEFEDGEVYELMVIRRKG